MLYMCTSCDSPPFPGPKPAKGRYMQCGCGELALPLSKFRDAWITAQIKDEQQATNSKSVPALVHGSGVFIELSCPACKGKLLAQVSLESRA
jgi:hypothetical protein